LLLLLLLLLFSHRRWAQVSNLAHIWAVGLLPGLTMKAGVMMSGGSQQCYNVPPLAKAQCADCDPSEQCMTPGCSGDVSLTTHHRFAYAFPTSVIVVLVFNQ
jgi:hypothetical protein